MLIFLIFQKLSTAFFKKKSYQIVMRKNYRIWCESVLQSLKQNNSKINKVVVLTFTHFLNFDIFFALFAQFCAFSQTRTKFLSNCNEEKFPGVQGMYWWKPLTESKAESLGTNNKMEATFLASTRRYWAVNLVIV